jgi:hypothetical protein
LRQLGRALLDLGEARLGSSVSSAPPSTKPRSVGEGFALLGVQAGGVDGLVLGVQALVGAQPGEELGDARQRLVVGGAQLGRVHDGLQVRDGAPGAAQALGGHVQRAGEGAQVARGLHHAFECGFGLLQQLIDGGGDVFGADGVEARQVGEVEQGLAVGMVMPLQMRAARSSFKASAQALARSAAGALSRPRVLTSSMVMVMGPTPPGTGVIQPATFLTPRSPRRRTACRPRCGSCRRR